MEGNIGFIGLGAMGYPMAANIRKKMAPASTLYINDVSPACCETFRTEYASFGPIISVKTAREVAQECAVLVSIVPAAKHVKDVYLNPETGVVAASKNFNRLMVECSTVDVETAREVAQTLETATAGTYVDAPVSGGVPAAAAGTLAFLIGSAPPPQAHPALEPLASHMGIASKFFYIGVLGGGLAAKIANNYLSGVHLLAAAEAMNIGIRSGVDKHVLYNAIHNSTGQSFMLDQVCPVPGVVSHAPSSRDYQGGFKAQMMIKDMGLGVDMARRTGVRATTGMAALELYNEVALDPRCIDRDISVVWRFLDGPE